MMYNITERQNTISEYFVVNFTSDGITENEVKGSQCVITTFWFFTLLFFYPTTIPDSYPRQDPEKKWESVEV